MPGALTGIRIVDLSRLLPGPLMTQILADLGAEVIKVEDPQGGDYLRHMPPLVDGIGAAFAALNRGKSSVALDLKNPDDRRRFVALCASADVLVESFRPGVMERLQLGPGVLCQLYPKLVYCRISGYGQDAPDAHRAGHDLNFVARAGLLGLTQTAQVPAVQVADVVGGSLLPAIEVLAALRLREHTQAGVVIDAAMIDGAWSMLLMPLSRHLAGNERLEPGSELLSGAVPSYSIYPTQDGALAVAALEPKFWDALCDALDCPQLKGRGLDRDQAGAEVKAILAAIFASRCTRDWDFITKDLDCCVEPLRPAAMAHLEDPALQSRERVAHIKVGERVVPLPLTPVIVGEDTRLRKGPPSLGEGNERLLEKV